MGARRFASLGVTWMCLLAGVVLFWAASARATEVHVFAGSFGSAGSGPGEFDSPEGVAVNDTTHVVYVADTKNNRVQELSFSGGVWTVIGEFNGSAAPTGALSEPGQIAVDNSTDPLDPSAGDVYVVDQGHDVVDKLSPTGVYEGQITGTPSSAFEHESILGERMAGVAVDSAGVVWLVQDVEYYNNKEFKTAGFIDSFSDAATNQYLSAFQPEEGKLGQLNADDFAVDSEDNLYIGNLKFSSSGALLLDLFNPLFDGEAKGVAVDATANEAYLDKGGSIEAIGLDGAPIESSETEALAPSFGAGHLDNGVAIAVDASDNTVYVADSFGDNVVAFEGVSLPSVSMGAVTEREPRSLRLNGTVDPEGDPVTSCVFEYGTTSTYGQSVPCSPEAAKLGSGTAAESVSAQLTGLVPGTTYHYRLVAENAAHISSSTPDRELVAGPTLGGESVLDVAASSATLKASVDPNGADTHYYFEYGTTTSYGTDVPLSAPGMDLGSGEAEQAVSWHLQGLAPDTVYHYRVVVAQGEEVFEGPDNSFTTQTSGMSSTLPDGRTWELVSPPNKKGALIGPFRGRADQVQAADDGSGVTYISSGPHVGESVLGKTTSAQDLSTRVSGGWKTVDVTLPSTLPETGEGATELSLGNPKEYPLFSSNLSLALAEPAPFGTPLLSSEATTRTLYLRDTADGSFVPLVTPGNTPAGASIEEPSFESSPGIASEFQMSFLAGTPDLRHVVLKTPLALTPEANDEEDVEKSVANHTQWNLYEWGEGKLQLVNILPENEGVASGPYPSFPGVRLAGTKNAGAGSSQGGAQRSMSSNGRWIAWTWGEPSGGDSHVERYVGLYVRDMVREKTVRVGGANPLFQTMTSNGSEVFYLENGDLYVYDVETGTQTDLTGVHGASEASAGVQEAVSDVSEDGAYVYFVAKGVLANGAVAGEYNLYLLHDTGTSWTTTYIVTLSPKDEKSWFFNDDGGIEDGAPIVPNNVELSGVSSRVSPNGHFLAFMSSRSLTGYDNLDAASGASDEEVYLYDAQTGRLACASCNPTGARPVGVFDSGEAASGSLLSDPIESWGEGNGYSAHWLAGSIPGWDSLAGLGSTYQPRYLSDGGRLFFDSPDALVPQDTNGLEDVYEYESPADGETAGSDSCTTSSSTFSERSGGCVNLITSGTSSAESEFYDASENGDDVFFATTSKLVSEDYDKGYDVYDAHVCSVSVPCVSVPVPSPPCTSGDSCKAAPSPQPEIFGSAPSATFSGIGNVTNQPSAGVVKAKSLTDAQKLARALKSCRKERGKRRSACEARARKRYPLKRPHGTVKKSGKGGRR